MSFLHEMSFGTINCRTLKDDIMLAQAVTAAKSLKHDLTFVQETHRTGNERLDFVDKLSGWCFINCGLKVKHAHGVGIIISPGVTIHDIEHIMPGRILYAMLTIRGVKLSVFSAYSPTEESPDSAKDIFYSKL